MLTQWDRLAAHHLELPRLSRPQRLEPPGAGPHAGGGGVRQGRSLQRLPYGNRANDSKALEIRHILDQSLLAGQDMLFGKLAGPSGIAGDDGRQDGTVLFI